MKAKIFTLAATMFCLSSMAQITRSNLLDFENSTVTDATATLVVQDAEYTTDLSYTNSGSTVNSTSKCAYFKGTTKKPLWWHGLNFTFPETVTTGANQYLHIMLKKSVEETVNVQVSLVNTDPMPGGQSAALMSTPLTTEWVDYVMTIPATHTTITQLYVKFNAQSADTECFADEILIDNSSAPRTTVATALNHSEKYKYRVYSENNKIWYSSELLNEIAIYNGVGQKVFSDNTNNFMFDAKTKGMYIVKINGFSQKVLVK